MFAQTLFGDQPHDVLRGAADEVLAVLKNENLKVRSATATLPGPGSLFNAYWSCMLAPLGQSKHALI